ncbi:MAG: hypothetical protein REI78_13290 [Pedobacter sp.]|nr:hypothetical protein [Pedobacter sp.]MDQ8054002.1 hypothetical protein [Pedobacter sp.]
MKKLNLTYVILTLLILLSAACKKDRNFGGKSTKDFVEQNGPEVQVFKKNNTVEQTLLLKNGTKIIIPAGAIRLNGQAVVGDVTYEAIEVLKRSDVLFSGTNTNHISGAPLASDGFIYLNASVNGVKVDKALAINLQISIPAKRTGMTQIWEGVEKVGNDNQMAWQAPAQNPNGGGIKRDVDAIGGNFTFDMGNLGWINCDVFYSYTNPKTTTTVSLVNNPGTMASFRAFSGETFVFFCAKGSNVAAQLYTPDGPNKVKSYDNMMPVGVQGKYISFSIKDGKFYYAELETTIVANQNITLTLAETTESQVQAAINSLNSY